MEKLDWKQIISKVLGWGFPSVFCILGLILIGAHKQFEMEVWWGVIITILGLCMYCFTIVAENRNTQRVLENQKLIKQVKELSLKVEQLTIENAILNERLDNYSKKPKSILEDSEE